MKAPQRPYYYIPELDALQRVYDVRFTRQGWRCTACGSRAKKGKMMGWVALIGSYPLEIVFWDTIACKELMERQGIFKRR